MSINVDCPGCKKRYEIDEALTGKKSRCKKCGEVFRIPAPGTADVNRPGRPNSAAGSRQSMREAVVDDRPSMANRASSGAFKIHLECPFCHRHYEVDGALAGRKSRCKDCGTVFPIPGPIQGRLRRRPARAARAPRHRSCSAP